MPGMPDVEAAEFAEYLQDERHRRERDPRARAGGMYRRAMMRAYAESVGAELAVSATPAPADVPTPPVPPSMLAAAPLSPVSPAPPMPVPRRQSRPAAPPRSLVGLAALALLVLAAGVIWGLIGRDVQPPNGAPETAGVSGPVTATQPPVATASSAAPRSSAPRPATTRASAQRTAAAVVAAVPHPRSTEGTLTITSQPAGARVTVNGIGWGQTPVTIRHLEFGAKRIRLTMQGYLSEERFAHLSPGDPAASTRIVLRRRAAPARPRPPVASSASR